MSLLPVKRVLLVQDSRISVDRKLHIRGFTKGLKEAGYKDIDVFKETSPKKFLKLKSDLYFQSSAPSATLNRASFVVVNELGLELSLLRKYLSRQLESAHNLGRDEAKVYYPRIVIFKAPAEESDIAALQNQLEAHYGGFVEAGIAKLAISEPEAIKELIDLLNRIDSGTT